MGTGADDRRHEGERDVRRRRDREGRGGDEHHDRRRPDVPARRRHGRAGKGTILRGLVVSGPATGGPSVSVQTTGTLLDTVSVQRVGSTDAPAVEYDDSAAASRAGTNAIKGSLVFLLQNPSAAGTAPQSTAARGPPDHRGLRGRQRGEGRRRPSPSTGTTSRAAPPSRTASRAARAHPEARRQRGRSALAPPRARRQGHGPGLRSRSPGAARARACAASSLAGQPILGATAGDHRRHRAARDDRRRGEAASALNAASLSASFLPAPLGTPAAAVGTITLTADRSIAHGAAASTVTAAAGSATQTGPTARLVIKDSDTTDTAGGTGTATTATSGAVTRTADDALFRNLAAKDIHLKATAPVVDKGGPQGAGESDKDFEGQARVAGAASDLGADEFTNTLPTAVLKADRTAVKEGETIAFDATSSADPDGPIAQYAINFGDGSPAETPATGKASHVFSKAGSFKVILGVADAAGGTGLAAVDVTVTDGTPPRRRDHGAEGRGEGDALHDAGRAQGARRDEGSQADTDDHDEHPAEGALHRHRERRERDQGRRALTAPRLRREGAEEAGTTTRTVLGKAAAASCTFLDAKAGKFVGGIVREARLLQRRREGRDVALPAQEGRHVPARRLRADRAVHGRQRGGLGSGEGSVHTALMPFEPIADPDTYRAACRGRWEEAAGGWAAAREAFQRDAAPVSDWLIDAINPQPGQTVLELAAGPGDTGLLAAELLRPGGKLISTDGALAMVQVAEARAEELGLADVVEAKPMEVEWIDLETAIVDAVLCRWGYMLVPDPETALRETRRVLSPGAAWPSRSGRRPRENPWMAGRPASSGSASRARARRTRPGRSGSATRTRAGAALRRGLDRRHPHRAARLRLHAPDLDTWWAQQLDCSVSLKSARGRAQPGGPLPAA